jgi:hypothetical protein
MGQPALCEEDILRLAEEQAAFVRSRSVRRSVE